MKKFFTLALLALFSFSAWAEEITLPATTLSLPTTGLADSWGTAKATHFSYIDETNHYVIYLPYAVRTSTTQNWFAKTGSLGSAEGTWDALDGNIFKGHSYYGIKDKDDKNRYDKIKKSTGGVFNFRVTNCTKVIAYVKLNKKADKIEVKAYEVTAGVAAATASVSGSYTDANNATAGTIELAGLDYSKEYVITVFQSTGGSDGSFYELAFYYKAYTVTYDLHGGSGTLPTETDKAAGVKFNLHDGETGITPPANMEFSLWKDQDSTEFSAGAEYTMPSKNVTLTAYWKTAAPKFDITFANGGHGTAPDAINDSRVDLVELTAAGYVHQGWVANQDVTVDEATVTAGTLIANGKRAYVSAATQFTAQWAQLFAITKGTPEHGTIDADATEAIAGTTITLTADPAANYMLEAWDVYKTGEPETKVTVTKHQFTMPAYAVTVNATFVTDTRAKVLYVTKNNEATTKSSDKLYAALKDDYNIAIVAADSSVTITNYALVVLHESVDGSNYNKAIVAAAKTTSVPVLNTKSYFYNNANTDNQRWNWGTPNAGKEVKGCTLNTSKYSNLASHPLFADVVSTNFVEIIDAEAAKAMQPIGEFTTGYEGYTLATSPNASSGNGCAIHEIPAGTTARGVSSGKYLLISVSSSALNALNANGQKLFQNAAAYLISNTAWEPQPIFYIAGMGADVWTPNQIPVYGTSYTFENLAAGSYAFKITTDGTWDTSKGYSNLTDTAVIAGLYGGENNNVCFTLADAGDVTITYDGEIFKAEGNFEPQVVKIKGGWDEWAWHTLTLSDDKKSASDTLTLEVAENVEFIVLINNDDYRKNGKTFVRNDNSATGITGNGDNMKLTSDKAGDYIFKWIFGTNALEITFPDNETAIDNVAEEGKAIKFIRNGQLFIEKNGHLYNAMGQMIK